MPRKAGQNPYFYISPSALPQSRDKAAPLPPKLPTTELAHPNWYSRAECCTTASGCNKVEINKIPNPQRETLTKKPHLTEDR